MSTYINRPNLEAIEKVPFLSFASDNHRAEILKKHKINNEEYQRLLDILGRTPTFAELGVFSAMWSEHCSYKSSKVHLSRFPTEGQNVVVGPGENAGVVRLKDKVCLAFKMESHNHPSFIDPYQGAATGVGGILRDVFCMGARPIANLNCLRFGAKDNVKTPWLLSNVVKGIGDYGNCIGVPTVGGNISFDSSYNGNCLVNAMTVGQIDEDKIFKGFASGIGNLVVYVGSATGRDGIHGATMASDSFESKEEGERGAVQVGDPFTEKLLLEATLDVLEKNLVVGIQDMGAAGLTSSSFEMADRAGNGLYLNLDKIPVRTENMSAYELLLSESQERMLMVIEPKNWEPLRKVLEKWNLHFDLIGEVTDTGRVQCTHHGKLEVDIPVSPLALEAPKYNRPLQDPKHHVDEEKLRSEVMEQLENTGYDTAVKHLLSKDGLPKKIYRQYDHHIGTKTVLGPDSGGAALLWIDDEKTRDSSPHLGAAISTACNEAYCETNPRLGGAYAVLKAAKMIAVTGAKPLAVTDCLNFGNPEIPEVMWQFSEAVDGISEACKELGSPVVSGNVSLYNETDGKSIAPTPMIGMVGCHENVTKAPPALLKSEESCTLYFLSAKGAKPSFGGSKVSKIFGLETRGELPPINWEAEREAISTLNDLAQDDMVVSCRETGQSPVLIDALKMTLPDERGLTFLPSSAENLFGEYGSGALFFVPDSKKMAFEEKTLNLKHNSITEVGCSEPDGNEIVVEGAFALSVSEFSQPFTQSLEI